MERYWTILGRGVTGSLKADPFGPKDDGLEEGEPEGEEGPTPRAQCVSRGKGPSAGGVGTRMAGVEDVHLEHSTKEGESLEKRALGQK